MIVAGDSAVLAAARSKKTALIASDAVAGFKDCYAIANNCYPPNEKNSLRKRLHFSLRIFFSYRTAINCIESFFASTALRRCLIALPGFREHLYVQQVRPCLYRRSLASHRIHFMTSHFRMLERTHREEVIEKFYNGSLDPIVFQDKGQGLGAPLAFNIYCHQGILKEGLLQLSMSVNGAALYRITFWLMDYEGVPTLCVGALQGGKGVLAANHAFTKEYWGLRPNFMALTALRWYAQTMGIKQIYTFAKKNLWCTGVSKQTDLDQFWEEQGGQAIAGTPFIKLALHESRKSMEEIASRKRSAYRKRYKFLDELRSTLVEQFSLYMKQSNTIRTDAPLEHALGARSLRERHAAKHYRTRRDLKKLLVNATL
jgi:uncharacterized protein